MRTCGHKEGSIRHWGPLEGFGEGQWEGRWGGIMWEEISGIGDGGMEAANHLAMNVLMQQPCKICTCTAESKVL